MARPEVSELSEQLYAALGWHASEDEENDWALLRACAVWCEIYLDPVYLIVREGPEGEKGWSLRLDPEGPADGLAYLAQWVGAVLTPEMTEEQQRLEIAEPTGWKRGQLPSLELAGKRGLTGTQRIVIRPRNPEVGMHYIRTLTTETPNPERTKATLRANLAAWEAMDYETFDGYTYTDLKANFATYKAVGEAFKTYSEIPEASLP